MMDSGTRTIHITQPAIQFSFSKHAHAASAVCYYSYVEFQCIFRIDWHINQLINVCYPLLQFMSIVQTQNTHWH